MYIAEYSVEKNFVPFELKKYIDSSNNNCITEAIIAKVFNGTIIISNKQDGKGMPVVFIPDTSRKP